jgi:hypothetical protein
MDAIFGRLEEKTQRKIWMMNLNMAVLCNNLTLINGWNITGSRNYVSFSQLFGETIAENHRSLVGVVMWFEEFNGSHQKILESSVWWLIDECMSAYCSCKTATGSLTALEIQHWKTEMTKQPKYELGAETACTLHLTENLPVADDMKVDSKGNHGLVASKAV